MRDLDMQELDALMRDKLETHCRQQLSAMLDGALAPDEARFLLRRLQHDHELAGCWERWQLCGDLMRGSMPALLPRDFSQRVLGAIGDEGQARAASAGSGSRAGHRWGWAGGAALAASVAVAALFIAQHNPAAIEPAIEPAASAPAVPLAAAGPAPVTTGAPRPALPEPSLPTPAPDAAAGVAAAALAASELPRRAAARRTREPLRRAPARQAPELPVVMEVAAIEPESGQAGPLIPDAAASAPHDPFAASALASSRPWPRAVLPGLASGALTVDYGPAGASSGYDYFEPQLPVDETPPD